jgi:hypothetical protein
MKKVFFYVTMLFIVSCSEDKVETQSTQAKVDEKIHVCSTLEAKPESNVTGRVSYKGTYWTPGQTISIKFLNGDAFLQNKVKQFASQWLTYANLKFAWVSSEEYADIKIGFKWNGDTGSWSNVGIGTTAIAQNAPSMNFGWFDATTTDTEFSRVVIHEFGHSLGLGHEHQNPAVTIQWNKPVVYDYYARTSGWSATKVDDNVLNPFSPDKVDYTEFDPQSIMLYSFPANFTLDNQSSPWNTTLSNEDKASIAKLYPSSVTSLLPNKSMLKSGEYLYSGYSLLSANKRYWLVMQTDGKLVIYDLANGTQNEIWKSATPGQRGSRVTMQTDGNFVITYNGTPFWQTGTQGNAGATLTMQDDGNLVIFLNDKALWSSKGGKTY